MESLKNTVNPQQGRKRKSRTKQIGWTGNKFQGDSTRSTITLNVNSVNTSIERQILSDWINKARPYQKSTLNVKTQIG